MDVPLLDATQRSQESSMSSVNLNSDASITLCAHLLPVPDMDDFVQHMYMYYLARGYWGFVAQQVAQCAVMACVLGLLILVTCFVDYSVLLVHRELTDAFRFSAPPVLAACLVLVGSVGVAGAVVSACRSVARMSMVRQFYFKFLDLRDSQLANTQWHQVLARTLPWYISLQGHSGAVSMAALHVRLMRMDHFLMLFTRISSLFHVGPRCMLSRTFFWGFWLTVAPVLRNPGMAPSAVQWRMRAVGAVGLLLSPFLLVLVVVYYLCQYGERVRKQPVFLGTRHWSLNAQWGCRRFDEPLHELRARLGAVEPMAQAYADSSGSDKFAAPVRVALFVCSAVVVLILALALVDDDVLVRNTLFGRLLVWWLGVAGAGVALFRSLGPTERPPQDTPALLKGVSEAMGMRPQDVAPRFDALYEYRALGFLFELASVVLAPLFFLAILPRRIDKLMAFVKAHSHDEYGLGVVCKPAFLALQQRGA